VEGAFIAVVCLLFADHLMIQEKRKIAAAVFAILMVLLFVSAFSRGVQTPNYGGAVPSRRDMTSPVALIFLGVLTYANLAFLVARRSERFRRIRQFLCICPTREDRMRGWYLFLFLAIFGTVWTLAEYLAGSRWIEAGIPGSTSHAAAEIECFWLAFDVLVDIAIAYVPFYTLPLGLRLIASLPQRAPVTSGHTPARFAEHPSMSHCSRTAAESI
jgi:hypothetical protein